MYIFKILLFLADKISEHNHRAVGSKNPEKSARVKSNRLRNKCKEAMNSCGIQDESAEYINWDRDIERSPFYLDALNHVKHLYQANDQFQKDIQESTRLALVSLKNGREKSMPDKSEATEIDLEEGVKYPLKELAFFSVVDLHSSTRTVKSLCSSTIKGGLSWRSILTENTIIFQDLV